MVAQKGDDPAGISRAYEAIADKPTTEIRDMVVDRIQKKLDTMETMNCW